MESKDKSFGTLPGLTTEDPVSRRTTCRTCNSPKLKLALDLGQLPLANAFLSADRARDPRPDPRYPLRVFYCENCGLIQLLDIVDKEKMFDDYAFLTSASRTALAHFDAFADEMSTRSSLEPGGLVIDIGSNDGTLLKSFQQRGAQVIGIEPAHNLSIRCIADGVPTLNEYFGPKTVNKIGKHKAQLITANNVVSHINDLDIFIDSVSDALSQDGLFAFEVPWVVDVIRHNSFDIIYHEHLSYFGFKPLSDFMKRHNLELIDLQHFSDIHGGTIRGIVAHTDRFPESGTVRKTFDIENIEANFQSLAQFAKRVLEIKDKLYQLLLDLKGRGKTIIGYGAPAKATILLNYCSIDHSILDFVTDTTPLKQGKFVPGVRVPIVAPDEISRKHPDFALLLAWNYEAEILKKEQNYLDSGGKFIIPFPEPEIID